MANAGDKTFAAPGGTRKARRALAVKRRRLERKMRAALDLGTREPDLQPLAEARLRQLWSDAKAAGVVDE